MKKKIILFGISTLISTLPMNAQSARGDINTLLSEYALPIFLGVMVMALLVGIAKNWRLINDETSEGNKKQGWMNIAYMIGYVMLAVAVISYAISKLSSINISI